METKDKKLRIGISPCPNDTFAFHGIINGTISLPFQVEFSIHDVEELNQKVLNGELHLSKVSFHLAAKVLNRYMILNSGAALGRGCGPLLLKKELPDSSHNDPTELLKGSTIAIPGSNTTAALLLRLYLQKHGLSVAQGDIKLKGMLFSQIEDAILAQVVHAGTVIHETRFTYADRGLVKLADLGEWWETETGKPIPLGCILGSRQLPIQTLSLFDNALKRSIEMAFRNPEPALEFAADHAREISMDVMKRHIDLYVNHYTLELGQEGREAIQTLFEMARQAGILSGPAEQSEIFVRAVS